MKIKPAKPMLFDMAGGVFIVGMLGIFVVIPIVAVIIIFSIGAVQKAKLKLSDQEKLIKAKELYENKDDLQ